MKNYITNQHPIQSREFEDGIFYNRIKYNYPSDNVPNMMLQMWMRDLYAPDAFNPYSNYNDFEFVDNLDGTFNVTVPMKMKDIIPSKCSFITLCELNDCPQEKNSMALIYGQDSQMLIKVVNPALHDAFQLDLNSVQLTSIIIALSYIYLKKIYKNKSTNQ